MGPTDVLLPWGMRGTPGRDKQMAPGKLERDIQWDGFKVEFK